MPENPLAPLANFVNSGIQAVNGVLSQGVQAVQRGFAAIPGPPAMPSYSPARTGWKGDFSAPFGLPLAAPPLPKFAPPPLPSVDALQFPAAATPAAAGVAMAKFRGGY